jgi:hypothetical protein
MTVSDLLEQPCNKSDINKVVTSWCLRYYSECISTPGELEKYARPRWESNLRALDPCYKLLTACSKLVDNLGQAVRIQLVDDLLADLLQDVRFLRVYKMTKISCKDSLLLKISWQRCAFHWQCSSKFYSISEKIDNDREHKANYRSQKSFLFY